MRNFVSVADTLDIAAPTGGAVGGELYAVGTLAGVWTRDGAEAELVPLLTRGVIRYTQANAAGTALYVDNTTQTLETAAAGAAYLGVSAGTDLIAVGVGGAP